LLATTSGGHKYRDHLVEKFNVFADFLHADSFWKKIKASPAALKALFRKDYLFKVSGIPLVSGQFSS
jgi:hypothetical protein